jgi:uncharacterized protein
MNMENFTPWMATLGGICVGLSAGLIFKIGGKVCGISGIFNQTLYGMCIKRDYIWRLFFVIGLIAGGYMMLQVYPPSSNFDMDIPVPYVVVAGLCVGYGTRLGSGCTSGHGICGLGRVSKRSGFATATFMSVAILVTYITQKYIY